MISSFSLLISRYFSMTEYLYWTECVCFGSLHTYCDCLSIYRFFNPVFFVRPHSCGSIGLYRCVFSFFLFNLMHTFSKRVYFNDSNVERFIQSATYNVNHNQLAASKMNLYAKIAHTISIRFFCFCEWRSVCVIDYKMRLCPLNSVCVYCESMISVFGFNDCLLYPLVTVPISNSQKFFCWNFGATAFF